MFQSIDYKIIKWNNGDIPFHQITLKDDAFEEVHLVQDYELLGGFKLVVDVYEQKKYNTTHNLIKFLEFETMQRHAWPLEKLLPFYSARLHGIYADKLKEVKKYLVLL